MLLNVYIALHCLHTASSDLCFLSLVSSVSTVIQHWIQSHQFYDVQYVQTMLVALLNDCLKSQQFVHLFTFVPDHTHLGSVLTLFPHSDFRDQVSRPCIKQLTQLLYVFSFDENCLPDGMGKYSQNCLQAALT